MDKFDKLLEILKSDKERAKELLSDTPDVAVCKLNEMGCDVTEDDLREVAKGIEKAKAALENGELSDVDLETVTGGSLLNNRAERIGYYVVTWGAVIAIACAPW